jgi:hypothetical protein
MTADVWARVPVSIKEALEKLALRESRSMSNMVLHCCREYIKAKAPELLGSP